MVPSLRRQRNSQSNVTSTPSKKDGRNLGVWLLVATCSFAQMATVAITWEAWQVRPSPINLSWIQGPAAADWVPDLDYAPWLMAALLLVIVRPRLGFPCYLVLLVVAVAADQLRCQPQVIGITILMSACIYPSMHRLTRWFLVAMWCWAGIHKLVSPDWLGWVSFHLLDRLPTIQPFHFELAVAVAVAETMLAGLPLWRPRWAAFACLLVHGGIVVLLLSIQWNYSVIPWNLATMLVGFWLLWRFPNQHESGNPNANASGVESRQIRQSNESYIPKPATEFWRSIWRHVETVIILVLIASPVGFYFGWLPHSVAHVLYSDNCPVATISTNSGSSEISTIGSLGFAFPRNAASYKKYFVHGPSRPGDKLCIWLPQWSGESRYKYYQRTEDSLVEIDKQAFFTAEVESGSVPAMRLPVVGVAPDNERAILVLSKAKADLLVRDADQMIYAVRLNPETYHPELLDRLSGLPNLEQIQLKGCPVSDDDLQRISPLMRLNGIGLNWTEVTDAGLEALAKHPRLRYIEAEKTQMSPLGIIDFIQR